MFKSIKAVFLVLLLSARLSSAQPIKLFGPIEEGSSVSQTGVGLACLSQPGGSDFVVGAPFVQTMANNSVYLASGKTGLLQIPAVDVTSNDDSLGKAVASLGDITGDSKGDFVAGAPNADYAKIYLSSGANPVLTLLPVPVPTFSIENFGSAVSLVEGSPVMVAVGSPRRIQVSTIDGAVSFYNALTGTFLYACNGLIGLGEGLGTSLSNIGDLDNDNVPDLVVGATLANSQNGEVVVLSVGSGANCTRIHTLTTGQFDSIGRSVSSVSDIDADGVDDFVAGGISDNPNGVALLYSGNPNTNLTTNHVLCRIDGVNAERLGSAVQGIGDTNYDGIPDFAIGAPAANAGAGSVYIYTYDSGTKTCPLLFTLNGTAPQTGFGSSLSGSYKGSKACDMNSDLFAEFLVASNDGGSGASSGAAFVFSVPTPTPTPTATPTATTTFTPTATATATPRRTNSPTPIRTPTKTPTVTPTPLLPTRAQFSYRITQNGTFVGTNALSRPTRIKTRSSDNEIYDNCTVRLLARYTSNDLSAASRTYTLTRSKRARQVTRFQTSNLHKPHKDTILKKPYILHVISKNTCAGRVFYSNVSSRYLTCGIEPKVEVDQFMTQLSTTLR